MQGIYLAALLTSAATLAVFGPLVHKLKLPAHERLLWLAAALAMPLQPLAFFFVRLPLDHALREYFGAASTSYKWLVTFYAPVTEELAKLVVLLIPAFRRDIRPENFVRYALAIGAGFSLGEIWFIAERITHIPTLATLPFYQFGGYMGERLMVGVFHATFVSVALRQWRRRLAWGVASAIALHWLGNFPLSLLAWNAWGLGRMFWTIFVNVFLALYFLAALALLARFALPRLVTLPKAATLFYGRRHCPECGADYEAPLLGLNFGRVRYERCPQCRHWHWTKSDPA